MSTVSSVVVSTAPIAVSVSPSMSVTVAPVPFAMSEVLTQKETISVSPLATEKTELSLTAAV